MHRNGFTLVLLFLVQEDEFPSLVHSEVFIEEADFGFIFAGCVDQVQTFVLVVGQYEDGFSKGREFKQSTSIEPKHLSLIPLGVVHWLEYSVNVEKTARVIFDPHISIFVINFKLLILFLFADLQSGLKVINGQHEIGLYMDYFVLLAHLAEHPQLVQTIALSHVACQQDAIAFLKFV